jgi:uncharacterized RDD family membrane protein YckC
VLAGSSLTQLIVLLFPRWSGLTDALRVAITAAMSIVPLAYFFLTVAVTGRTLGKALLGIRIVNVRGGRVSTGWSLVRSLAYVVSAIPLGAGFWWVLVDAKRRGWHDHLARTQVVHDSRPWGL